MSVNVQILGVRRTGVGVERAVLWIDLMVGTSHQTLPFHEAQLARIGTTADQVSYIVKQAMAAAAASLSVTTLPPGVPDLRGTTAATGSIAMAGLGVTQRTVTADATVGLTDYLIFVDATAGNVNLTLPTSIGNGGQRFEAVKIDSTSHTVTLTPAGSEKIDGAATLVLTLQGQGTVITSTGAAWVHTPGVVAQVNMTAAQLAAVSDAAAKSALTALSAGLVAEGIFAAPV